MPSGSPSSSPCEPVPPQGAAARGRYSSSLPAWLSQRQVEEAKVVGTALEGHGGAVSYSPPAYREAREDGITEGAVRDQWLVAATQAIPGLIPPR